VRIARSWIRPSSVDIDAKYPSVVLIAGDWTSNGYWEQHAFPFYVHMPPGDSHGGLRYQAVCSRELRVFEPSNVVDKYRIGRKIRVS